MITDERVKITTIEEREQIKNRAVEVRESGDLVGSEELLKQVIDWDEANQNYRGQVDALGHLRIVYTKLAEDQTDLQEKQAYRASARECVDKALGILDAHPEIPQGPKSTLQVHLASTIFDSAKESGADVELFNASEFSANKVDEFDFIAFGCFPWDSTVFLG